MWRRRQELGLTGSGATTRKISLPEKRQLIVDQLAKDPSSHRGPKTVQANILYETGVNLTRYVVLSICQAMSYI